MGYPLELFINEAEVDEEFKCSICQDVLRSPIMSDDCEHVFCTLCIATWMQTSSTCPIDRKPIGDLRPPMRSFINMYNRLGMKCKYDGCTQLTNIEGFEGHVHNCQYDPEFIKPCGNNCGSFVKVKDIPNHNCIVYLKEKLGKANAMISQLNLELDKCDQKYVEFEQIKESQIIKWRKRVGILKMQIEGSKKAHVEAMTLKDKEIDDLKEELINVPKGIRDAWRLVAKQDRSRKNATTR